MVEALFSSGRRVMAGRTGTPARAMVTRAASSP